VVVPGRDDVVVPRGTDVDARDVVDVDVDPGTVVADDDVDVGDAVVVVARAAEVGGATVVPLVACVEPAVPGLAAVAGRTRM
jgi:hypothetical protein